MSENWTGSFSGQVHQVPHKDQAPGVLVNKALVVDDNMIIIIINVITGGGDTGVELLLHDLVTIGHDGQEMVEERPMKERWVRSWRLSWADDDATDLPVVGSTRPRLTSSPRTVLWIWSLLPVLTSVKRWEWLRGLCWVLVMRRLVAGSGRGAEQINFFSSPEIWLPSRTSLPQPTSRSGGF